MKCPYCKEEEYIQIGNKFECMECVFDWEEEDKAKKGVQK